MPERMTRGQRLIVEDVERSPCKVTSFEQRDEILVDDDLTPRDIGEMSAGRQRCKVGAIEQPTCVGGHRQQADKQVRSRQKCTQFGPPGE